MALVQSGTFGSSPSCAYEIHATQTGGTGNRRTVQLTVKFKVNGSSSQSSYGYSINWKGRVHNNYSGWNKVKGNEFWYGGQGFRSYSWTETVDVGTTSEKDITVGFQTDRPDGSSSWETTKTATFRVGKTNTAPSLSGNLDIYNDSNRSQKLTGIIPENISGLYLSWGAATDSEGGTLNYSLNQSKNNAGYGRVYFGTSRNYSMNIGGGNEGEKHRFFVDVQDNGGLWSNKVYSTEITKNTLTAGRITSTSVSTIGFSTTSFVVNFGGGSNADGSAVKYKFFSDYIPVLNQTSTTGTNQTVTIWKSGSTPTGPYIRFEDLKNYVRSTNYTGTLQIALETSNNYGTKKYSYSTISINLQVSPTAATSCDIQMNTNSTAYKKVASGNNYYLIPSSDRYVQIRWAGGGCQLGSPTTYRLYVQYGSGSWQVVADKLSPSTTSYNHTIPAQTQSTTVKYKIVVVTEFNSTAERVSPAQTLHYYSGVSLTVGNIVRGATTAEVNITVKTQSSIPNINTKGSWSCNGKTGTLSVTQNSQKISLSGLADNGTYTLSVTYNDDTGFSANKVSDIKIGANQPIFFVNKYGVGIGGLKASSSYALDVKGNSRIQGAITATGMTLSGVLKSSGEIHLNGQSMNINRPVTTGGWARGVVFKSEDGATTLGSIGMYGTGPSTIYSIYLGLGASAYDGAGGLTITSSELKFKNNLVYHAGRKPTPSEIGAATTSHTHNYLPLSGGTLTGHLRLNNGLNICLPNNNGITGKDTSGSDRYMMYMDNSNRIHLGYQNINQIFIDGRLCVNGGEAQFANGSYSDPTPGIVCSAKFSGNIATHHLYVGKHRFDGWWMSNSTNVSGDVSGPYVMGISSDCLYFRPYTQNGGGQSNNTVYLGGSSARWKTVYLASQPNVSSDLRKKKDISYNVDDDEKLEIFFDNLKPSSYVMKDGDSGRVHFGFVAQEVEEAMEVAGMDYKDCAFLQKTAIDENGEEIQPYTVVEDPENEGVFLKSFNITDYENDDRIKDYDYSLSYGELISVNTHFIQKVKNKTKILEETIIEKDKKISELEERLNIIEEKMK